MLIPAPFCSFYTFHRPCSYCFRVIIAHPCSILFFSFNVQTLLLLFRVITAHPSPILLFVCIPQTLLLLFRVITAHVSSIILLLCIPQTLLLLFRHPSPILLFVCIPQILLFRVISTHHISITLFFAFQRAWSYCFVSFQRIPAPFCSLTQSTDLVLTLYSH